MANNELTVWKYNKSGRIPHRVLAEMAENENLSFEAIGVFVTLFLTGEVKPEPQRLRLSGTSGVSVKELLKHGLLVSDRTLDIIAKAESKEQRGDK